MVVEEEEANKAACRRTRQGRVANEENWWQDTVKSQGHWKMRLSKPKLSFLHYPLSSMNYFENYSRADHIHLHGLCLGDMSPAHASAKTNKGKNQKFFPHKAQDKLTPFTYSRRKWVFSWLLFRFYHMSTDYRDSSTLSMTEKSTVVQNKIVNSNFYSYTVCGIELKWLLSVLVLMRTGL